MKKCLIFFLIMIITATSSSCFDSSDWFSDPKWYNSSYGYKDEIVIPLNEEINTMQDAYDFALNRVNEWGINAVVPHDIKVYFVGNQIKYQRGIIEYSFIVDNGKDKYLADAIVTIDMEQDVSTSFNVWLDPRTKGGTQKENWELIKTRAMDTSKWKITLDEAFKIIYETLGDDAFSRFENPKISLYCGSEEWIFNITKENETTTSTGVRHLISINPITKQIIKIKGFEDNEL